MKIYAVHTDDGAPINESALCETHLKNGDAYQEAYAWAANAEDRPAELRFTVVKRPECNDTVCNECRLIAAAEKGLA